ncbi:MAG: tail fiber protein [Bacteroidales bacterium]|nr:tail fiber protein [Bacteroidales bacterium]
MDSFIGEIRAFPYTFVPEGWMECDGRELNRYQYQLLFAVIGYTYGGDNVNKFNLPDLRGQAILNFGQNPLGSVYFMYNYHYGTDSVTLDASETPVHTHNFQGIGGASSSRTSAPGNDNLSHLSNVGYTPAGTTTVNSARAFLSAQKNQVTLNIGTIGLAYGSKAGNVYPHENRSPLLVIRYCICVLDGEYPPHPTNY